MSDPCFILDDPTPFTETEYMAMMKRIEEDHQKDLKKRGAVDFIAGHNFVGYVGESDGKWWVDVYSCGVNHGKIFGDTRQEIEAAAFLAYDGLQAKKHHS